MTKENKEMIPQIIGFIGGIMIFSAFMLIVMRTLPTQASDAIIITNEEFNIIRYDLIPYGKCLCNIEQECFCYPI